MTNHREFGTAVALVLMIMILLMPSVQSGHAPPGPCEYDKMGNYEGDDPRCIETPPGGAACVGLGLVVVESTAAGTAIVVASESRADAGPSERFLERWTPARTPDGLDPLEDPHAEADADQAGFSYDSLGVSVSARNVFSECGVKAGFGNWGPETHAYGRAGVSDLVITSGASTVVAIELLDYELGAIGNGDSTQAWTACDYVQVNPVVNQCDPPASIYAPSPLLVAGHHSYGPQFNGWDFQTGVPMWAYGGAVLHVELLNLSGNIVDVYVGYVAVGVTGDNAEEPFWHQ